MKLTVREIVESAMLIALAIVLDLPFCKVQIGHGGGSISLTMLPLFVLALRHGPIKGLISIGLIYGGITCLLDGWGFATFPFDYFLGYGSIAIVGFFKKKILENSSIVRGIVWITISVSICIISRYISGCLSSMILYEYTLEASLIYNLTYIIPSGVITLDLLIVLYKPLLSINKRFPTKSIWKCFVFQLVFNW